MKITEEQRAALEAAGRGEVKVYFGSHGKIIVHGAEKNAIASLVRKGLIERQSYPANDADEIYLLTDKGRAVLDAHEPADTTAPQMGM